jgi:glucokinase
VFSKKDSSWLATKDFGSFLGQLEHLKSSGFLGDFTGISAFVVAGAGPTKSDKYIHLTQVPWVVDLGALPEKFRVTRSVAINDFAAQAYACLSPIQAEAETILSGCADPNGTIAVVGAGTGLGVAALIRNSNGVFQAIPSEGGHINYSPESDQEYAFIKFLSKELSIPYPTVEDTLSGRGLKLTHKFVTGEDLSPEEISKKLKDYPKTIEFFAKSYGRACRNTALQYISSGGLFIAGGIAARNRELVKHPAFEQSFRGTRQHKEMIKNVEVKLLDNQESGLWGAAYLATQLV